MFNPACVTPLLSLMWNNNDSKPQGKGVSHNAKRYYLFKNKEKKLMVEFDDSYNEMLQECRISEDEIMYQGNVSR